MHFITFPVASTNIFPLVNSKQGGQLVTEFNLKAREMVATNPEVQFAVGPSFIHSMEDFKISLLDDSDVDDYDASKDYVKGEYCIYENNTYICIKDTTSKVKQQKEFHGDGTATTFKFKATEKVYSILRVFINDELVPDTDYELVTTRTPSVIKFNTAPANESSILVDYEVTQVTNPSNANYWAKTSISTSILQIAPGRAVVNGHYVETLAPMQVDLNLANTTLKQQSQSELYGNLSIGIKSYFSTENTMAGAMLVENTDNMYVGIQLVIELTENFKVPGDPGCCLESERGNVTADIKLADFSYVNGVISKSSIHPNENAVRYISSSRIYDFDNLLDDKYVTASNLVDDMFYTYSGSSGWCESNDSLMIWDAQPASTTVAPPAIGNQARFEKDANGNVYLVVPHKQQDAHITNDNGDRLYYADRVIAFPTAEYNSGTSGIVTKDYTQAIKNIDAKLNNFRNFTNGRQIAFVDVLEADSEGNLSYEFPKDLSPTNYNVGDYIIVREDYTVVTDEGAESAPSTMYFVLPGGVEAISFVNQEKPDGVRLGNAVLWAGDGVNPPTAENPDDEELKELFGYTSFKGVVDKDYFELVFHNVPDNRYDSYYYKASSTGPMQWSSAVMLTGGVPLATDTQIGGFYNATDDPAYEDAGYVYLDDTGHLRLLDYALLRTGALAYQLGADFSVPANETLDYVQADLDEMVNARVAFFTQPQITNWDDVIVPPMVDVTIPLPADEEGTINIYNIDSRFDTGVYLHFTADDTNADFSNIVINIVDCEKVRIDSGITVFTRGPIINLFRTCLYYDVSVINYIRTCDPAGKRAELFENYPGFTGFSDLTLWYARFLSSDPNLVVNGMEVFQPEVSASVQDITFWDENVANDNHYSCALRSITLSGEGKIVSCSLYVSNNSTQKDVDTVSHVIIGGDFVLPQGTQLNYPEACIDDPLMVTGTFTTAYLNTDKTKWIVTETSFTAKTGVSSFSSGVSNGSIAFNSKTDLVSTIYTNMKKSIDGWKPGAFHIFYGGTTE